MHIREMKRMNSPKKSDLQVGKSSGKPWPFLSQKGPGFA